MELDIINTLKELEKLEEIKILYACESGSRAWGTDSLESDYDVRFIYLRDLNWYLQLNEGPDVIEIIPNCNMELVGWDLKKALKLLQKSNPTLLEWVHSPITYICDEEFAIKLKNLSKTAFSPTSTIYHYVNMAKKNYKLLQKDQTSSTKRYLNILRPLITCLFILENKEMPAYDVLSLFKKYVNDFTLIIELERLLIAKKNGQHEYKSMQINQYVEETISTIEEKVNYVHCSKTNLTDYLNQFFIQTLKHH